MKTLQEAIEEYKKSPSFSLAADRVEEVHQKLAFEKGYYAGLEAANASERFRAEDAVAALTEENRLREQLSALQQENAELHLKAAELHSLRMSIFESPLKGFFPEREMSFHDKVIFAIHDMQHKKLLAWDQMQEVNEKLRKFKEYVHDRLDKMGVPSDPEPEKNAEHGCRIEGRLNFIEDKACSQHP